jgi:hypothetical protein
MTASEFLHCVVVSLCSDTSEERTAYIFGVTELVQVDAKVKQLRNVSVEVSIQFGKSQLQNEGHGMGIFTSQWKLKILNPFQGLNQ